MYIYNLHGKYESAIIHNKYIYMSIIKKLNNSYKYLTNTRMNSNSLRRKLKNIFEDFAISFGETSNKRQSGGGNSQEFSAPSNTKMRR